MRKLLTMFLTCCVALSFLGLFGLCNKKDEKKDDGKKPAATAAANKQAQDDKTKS